MGNFMNTAAQQALNNDDNQEEFKLQTLQNPYYAQHDGSSAKSQEQNENEEGVEQITNVQNIYYE